MLILLPLVVIILIIFIIDITYFDSAKPTNEPTKKAVEKTDNRKNYIDKYIKQ